jgi:predicted lipoprotein
MAETKERGLTHLYFVLKPVKSDEHGLAARKAIRTYAVAISSHNQTLALDLVKWMDELDGGTK